MIMGEFSIYSDTYSDRYVYEEYFPLARVYSLKDVAVRDVVCESRHRSRAFGHSERHIQAVWYDAKWRPENLVTATGERIRVEYPGRWNLEAGPDFLGATIVVGSDERRITGDVEVHIFPGDWKGHGHQDDKRYRNVCLHVTYYEGILPDDVLPSGALQLPLRPLLQRDPAFAFEHIDISMYPYAGRAELPPCRIELSEWPVEKKAALLEAAGHERLRRKAGRFAADVSDHGMGQAFYRAFLSALGYQHNRRPFRVLAELLPLDRLRVLSRGDPQRAYALLAGVSGLLPEAANMSWDSETRRYIRSLWDIWWKEQDSFTRTMKKDDWRLNRIRPLNHPMRRMTAAAHLFAAEFDLDEKLRSWISGITDGTKLSMHAFMEPEKAPYWERRASMGGQPKVTGTAILGKARLDTIALNVLIPAAVTMDISPDHVSQALSRIKPEPFNQLMRQAAFYLFGPDAPSILYDSAIRRQGLLQIFQDFCMQDRSRCSQCAFPKVLAGAGEIKV